MWREVARFEAQLQRREFLTGLYVAVFFFLTFGYTSSEVVELVADRGPIPRNAPWALAHAMAGVTAFGQVITTMITATAVMRDVALRQQELLFATRLRARDYLLGRWAGALLVMLVVYAAIPIGLAAGTAMPWVDRSGLLAFDWQAYLRPLLLLVVPNVLLVSALFFAAGALGRSFMTILLLGVGLVALWSSGVSLAREGVAAGALLDPFGNAALTWTTREWTPDARAQALLPWSGWLAANRALWLAVGAAALGWLMRRFRLEVVVAGTPRSATSRDRSRVEGGGGARDAAPRDATAGDPTLGTATSLALRSALLRRPTPPSRWQQLAAEAGFTLRWTLRERGFLTLALLGALNALANAWRAGGPTPTALDVLGAVQEHARIFLILVATIYAGELVWRERDVRSDALRDVLPGGTGTLVAGKIAGILLAQVVLVLPLLVVALLAGIGRGAAGLSIGVALAWIGGMVYPFLAQLTLLSLLVHAVAQDKVAGHVTLIAGWVMAVAMERTREVPPWLRYANLPAFTWSPDLGFGGDGVRLVAFVGYWSAMAAACGILAALWWVRGVQPPFRARLRRALDRSRGLPGALLAVAALLASLAWRLARD